MRPPPPPFSIHQPLTASQPDRLFLPPSLPFPPPSFHRVWRGLTNGWTERLNVCRDLRSSFFFPLFARYRQIKNGVCSTHVVIKSRPCRRSQTPCPFVSVSIARDLRSYEPELITELLPGPVSEARAHKKLGVSIGTHTYTHSIPPAPPPRLLIDIIDVRANTMRMNLHAKVGQ